MTKGDCTHFNAFSGQWVALWESPMSRESRSLLFRILLLALIVGMFLAVARQAHAASGGAAPAATGVQPAESPDVAHAVLLKGTVPFSPTTAPPRCPRKLGQSPGTPARGH